MLKNLPVNVGDGSSVPGQEDPLEKEMAKTNMKCVGSGAGGDKPGLQALR